MTNLLKGVEMAAEKWYGLKFVLSEPVDGEIWSGNVIKTVCFLSFDFFLWLTDLSKGFFLIRNLDLETKRQITLLKCENF